MHLTFRALNTAPASLRHRPRLTDRQVDEFLLFLQEAYGAATDPHCDTSTGLLVSSLNDRDPYELFTSILQGPYDPDFWISFVDTDGPRIKITESGDERLRALNGDQRPPPAKFQSCRFDAWSIGRALVSSSGCIDARRHIRVVSHHFPCTELSEEERVKNLLKCLQQGRNISQYFLVHGEAVTLTEAGRERYSSDKDTASLDSAILERFNALLKDCKLDQQKACITSCIKRLRRMQGALTPPGLSTLIWMRDAIGPEHEVWQRHHWKDLTDMDDASFLSALQFFEGVQHTTPALQATEGGAGSHSLPAAVLPADKDEAEGRAVPPDKDEAEGRAVPPDKDEVEGREAEVVEAEVVEDAAVEDEATTQDATHAEARKSAEQLLLSAAVLPPGKDEVEGREAEVVEAEARKSADQHQLILQQVEQIAEHLKSKETQYVEIRSRLRRLATDALIQPDIRTTLNAWADGDIFVRAAGDKLATVIQHLRAMTEEKAVMDETTPECQLVVIRKLLQISGSVKDKQQSGRKRTLQSIEIPSFWNCQALCRLSPESPESHLVEVQTLLDECLSDLGVSGSGGGDSARK